MSLQKHFQSDVRFLELGDGFSDEVQIPTFPKLTLRFRNQPWAMRVGLGGLNEEEWNRYMGALNPLPGNLQPRLALRYHGHQFRSYNPNLGDGRGILHAQFRDPVDQRLLDLGTKGSGTTPWSRGGDGRLTLKGGVREILATEMLEALGVNTSKTFSIIETHEKLIRYDEPSPTRSCVMVRLSHSHIRFGSFQRLQYFKDNERLEQLVQYASSHLVSDVDSDAPNLALALFEQVVKNAAQTCASWMVAGFVHGVLNTDNMNITGESFDYGPWRFIPNCDPSFVAAYFDHTGLYSYSAQPDAVAWNLARLAETFSPLCPVEELQTILSGYGAHFSRALQRQLLRRLGIDSNGEKSDGQLSVSLFQYLESSRVSFDQFFHDWFGGPASEYRSTQSPVAHAYKGKSFDPVREHLMNSSPTNPDALTLPAFAKPNACSMLIDEVESIWSAIDQHDDWSALEAKVRDVRALGLALGNGIEQPPELSCGLLDQAANSAQTKPH